MASRSSAYTPRVAEPCRAIGPILVGVAPQVHVLQRGSVVNAIVNLAILPAGDAQEQRRPPRPHE